MLRSGAEHRRADLKRQIGLGSEAVVEALDRKELGPGRAVRVADDIAVPQLRVVHAVARMVVTSLTVWLHGWIWCTIGRQVWKQPLRGCVRRSCQAGGLYSSMATRYLLAESLPWSHLRAVA